MKKLSFVLLAAIALLLGSCTNEKKIVIVSTNDMHSNIDRFPALATVVDSLRTIYPDLLLVDAGDRRTGNPFSDRAPKSGYPIIELMNTLGYDIATHGNHEFDEGTDTLAARNADSRFSYVLANMEANGSLQQHPPYEIREVKGVKILFLGLITNYVNGHPDGIEENFGNATFTDPVETALTYADRKNEADIMVAITHIGYENDKDLANRMPEIDLIVGGHSHTAIPYGEWHGTTVVTQTGSRLANVGVTTLTVVGKKIVNIENHLIDLKKVKPSPKYVQMVEDYKNNPAMQVAAGETTAAMNKLNLLNFLSDAVRKETNADFAFYNVGGVRSDTLQMGVITYADIYSIEPFGNYPVTVKMTADDLKSIILNKFNSSGSESHRLDLYPSGFEYEIITDEEGNGTDVIFRGENGAKFPVRKTYNIALSNYVWSEYHFTQQSSVVPDSPTPIAELIKSYLEKNSPVTPSDRMRVVIGR